jgi:RNA polymerase sigma-70 factor (ECF subfamily)
MESPDGAEPTDGEIVIRYLADGDPSGLDLLVKRHAARLRAVVFPLVLHEADADDVVQESFIKGFAGLRRFRGDATFASWIYRIGVNTAKNYLRKRGRQRLAWIAPDVLEETCDRRAEAPPDMAVAGETEERICRCMERLPLAQRVALSLVAIQGIAEHEAARIAACRPATLRWRLHRARQRMRALLQDGESGGAMADGKAPRPGAVGAGEDDE